MATLMCLNLPLMSVSCILLLLLELSGGLPLSTDSRWIVDEKGERVKLACVNWSANLEPMVAEGLTKQPMEVLSKRIKEMGFNCVRLTWPLYLVTNHSLASLSVRHNFLRLGLSESIAALQANNPSILDLSLIKAFQAVVASLANNKVMVILDNHITKPGWCCNALDGNGFFGDQYFNPNLWIRGLKKMARLFEDNRWVVGMSLRNELRGPRQNAPDWYRYMQRGAKAVHRANPNALLILSGLTFDTDLSFLHSKPISLPFTQKLVFEIHWYAFNDGQGGRTWTDGNPNEVCGGVISNNTRLSGFLLDKGKPFPLFVSEFGIDLRGTNVAEYRYFSCFLAWAAEYDLDWALWTLTGSYYLRQGVVGMNEYYGVLNWNWSAPRNASFLKRISVIQSPLQGPGSPKTSRDKIIFHPLTGLCIVQTLSTETLKLGYCLESSLWTYTSQKIRTTKGKHKCLEAQGLDNLVRTVKCRNIGTTWKRISKSKLHLATTLSTNNTICLDVNIDNKIIATTCKCLSGKETCDPTSQWFKIVDASKLGVAPQPQLFI